MKKLFAIAIATILSQAAFAAGSTHQPTATPSVKAEKACYMDVHVDADTSSDNVAISTEAGGFGQVRVPCETVARK